jgi:hypothetical protein
MEEKEILQHLAVFNTYNDLLELSSNMMNRFPGSEENAVKFLDEQKDATLDFIENEGSQEMKEAIPYWANFLQDDIHKPAEDFSQAIKRFAIILALMTVKEPKNARVFVQNMVNQQELKSEFNLED